jgi:hypothetical protein
MRPIPLLLVSILIAVPLAQATPKSGEEALALDLSSLPGGVTLFLKCNGWLPGREHAWTNCGTVGLWEQTNPVPGLQTSIFSMDGKPWEPDARLLG